MSKDYAHDITYHTGTGWLLYTYLERDGLLLPGKTPWLGFNDVPWEYAEGTEYHVKNTFVPDFAVSDFSTDPEKLASLFPELRPGDTIDWTKVAWSFGGEKEIKDGLQSLYFREDQLYPGSPVVDVLVKAKPTFPIRSVKLIGDFDIDDAELDYWLMDAFEWINPYTKELLSNAEIKTLSDHLDNWKKHRLPSLSPEQAKFTLFNLQTYLTPYP